MPTRGYVCAARPWRHSRSHSTASRTTRTTRTEGSRAGGDGYAAVALMRGFTRAASLAPGDEPKTKRGPAWPLSAIVHRRSALLGARPLPGRRLLGGAPLRGALLGRRLLGRPPLGRRLLGRPPLRGALLGAGLLARCRLPPRGGLLGRGLRPSRGLLRRAPLRSALLGRGPLPRHGPLGRPPLRSALLRAAPLGHRHALPPFVPSPSGLSGRHAFQAPPFPFAHPAPHAVAFIAAEGVVEAFDADGTLATDPLGLPR